MLRRFCPLSVLVQLSRSVLLPLIPLMLASCGDFQDPGAGVGQTPSTSAPTSPALTQPAPSAEERLQPETRQEPMVPVYTAGAPQPATEPIPVPLVVSSSAAPLPKASTRVQIDRKPRKSVTLAWDSSDRAAGYRVKVRSLSTTMQYHFDTGLQTELTLLLPLDQQYSFTVVAYNQAGESPPSDLYNFALY